eukprot:1158916-Pelagomonas_calceolata.AAC.9
MQKYTTVNAYLGVFTCWIIIGSVKGWGQRKVIVVWGFLRPHLKTTHGCYRTNKFFSPNRALFSVNADYFGPGTPMQLLKCDQIKIRWNLLRTSDYANFNDVEWLIYTKKCFAYSDCAGSYQESVKREQSIVEVQARCRFWPKCAQRTNLHQKIVPEKLQQAQKSLANTTVTPFWVGGANKFQGKQSNVPFVLHPQGIQFVKHLSKLDVRTKQLAEVAVYFKRFDEAEQLYHKMDRPDLAIEMRMRLGACDANNMLKSGLCHMDYASECCVIAAWKCHEVRHSLIGEIDLRGGVFTCVFCQFVQKHDIPDYIPTSAFTCSA